MFAPSSSLYIHSHTLQIALRLLNIQISAMHLQNNVLTTTKYEMNLFTRQDFIMLTSSISHPTLTFYSTYGIKDRHQTYLQLICNSFQQAFENRPHIPPLTVPTP